MVMEDTKKINKVDFNKKGNYKVKLIYKHKNKKNNHNEYQYKVIICML